MKVGLLALAGLLATAGAGAACPPERADGELLAAGGVTLAWRADPAPVVQGRPFALLVKVCPATAVLAAVDATMPEHRHGMNYRPSLQAQEDGTWRVDGLLWHMSGRWALRFDVRHDGRVQVLQRDVVLP